MRPRHGTRHIRSGVDDEKWHAGATKKSRWELFRRFHRRRPVGERYERREVRDGVFEDFLLKSKIRERTTGENITIIIIITITSVEFFILLLCVITIITITITIIRHAFGVIMNSSADERARTLPRTRPLKRTIYYTCTPRSTQNPSSNRSIPRTLSER